MQVAAAADNGLLQVIFKLQHKEHQLIRHAEGQQGAAQLLKGCLWVLQRHAQTHQTAVDIVDMEASLYEHLQAVRVPSRQAVACHVIAC